MLFVRTNPAVLLSFTYFKRKRTVSCYNLAIRLEIASCPSSLSKADEILGILTIRVRAEVGLKSSCPAQLSYFNKLTNHRYTPILEINTERVNKKLVPSCREIDFESAEPPRSNWYPIYWNKNTTPLQDSSFLIDWHCGIAINEPDSSNSLFPIRSTLSNPF